MTRLGKLHDVQTIRGPHGFPSRLPVTLSSDAVEQKQQLQHAANTMALAAVGSQLGAVLAAPMHDFFVRRE